MAFLLLDMEMSSFRGWIFGMAIVDCLANICVRAGRYYGRVKTNDRQPDETMKQLFTAFLILSSAAASLGALASFAYSLELGSFIFISLNTLGSIGLFNFECAYSRVRSSNRSEPAADSYASGSEKQRLIFQREFSVNNILYLYQGAER